MLRPGSIQLLYFQTLYGQSKDKFCLTVYLNPRPCFFLINSTPSKLEREQPEIWDSNVPIDQANHQFLNYDSYIDCSDPCGMDLEIANSQMADGSGRYKGMISRTVHTHVRSTVERSSTLARVKIKMLIEGLDSVKFD